MVGDNIFKLLTQLQNSLLHTSRVRNIKTRQKTMKDTKKPKKGRKLLPPRVIPNQEDISFMVCINQLPLFGRSFKLAMQAEHLFQCSPQLSIALISGQIN
jgi:hypothetical protein